MARSLRFGRPCAWLTIISLAPLVLFAGCRSSSSSQSYSGSGCCGGGGGCCRGAKPADPLAASVRSSSAAVDPLTAPSANRSNSAAANASPSAALPAQELYRGQKTCPVSGHDLGSMGPAIPVTVKGQTIYVCCRGCVAKVQRDPDGYLRKVEAERRQLPGGTS